MNCSISPVNPYTKKDSTLFKELLYKYADRQQALLKYGDYLNNNPELFQGDEPPLSYFESVEREVPAAEVKEGPINEVNSNPYIDAVAQQSLMYSYNDETKEYKDFSTGKTPSRVTSVVQYFTGREPKLIVTDEEIAAKEADKLWNGYDKAEKLLINNKEVTYDQYVANTARNMKLGVIKGNAIHSWLQYAASKDPKFEQKALEYEAQTIGEGLGGAAIDYSWARSYASTIFKNAGISLKPFGALQADVIAPEVVIGNNLINMSGTADMVVYHDDSTVSIVDWKTGSGFTNSSTDKLLSFGLTSRLITDSPKNRAKLQIALYAFMLKLNNPDMQFKNLKVAHIPDSHTAGRAFVDADVDMDNYIPMIEALFKDKKFLEIAALPTDTYKKIKEASPRAFVVGDYQSTTATAYSDLIQKGAGPATMSKIADINYLANKKEIEGSLSKEEQKVLAKATQDLLDMENILGVKLPREIPADYEIGLFTKLTGTYMDTNNPYLKLLKVLQDQRMDKAVQNYTKIEQKFEQLLQDVRKEHGDNKVGKTLGRFNFDSNPAFWDWAYNEVRDEEGNYSKTLLTDEDVALWDRLSNSQKALLKYVNDTQEKVLTDPNSHLNKIVYKENGESYTALDWYNLQTNQRKLGFKYQKGWFAKTMMTEAEVNRKNGGRLKLATLKEKMKIMLTDFIETNYEGINQYGIPLKYIGSSEIQKSGNYSSNLEQSFLTFMKQITLKEQLDDVYSLAQGIKAIHIVSENKNQNVLFKNTLEFIDDRVLADLVGRAHKDALFRIPFVMNKNGDKLDVYKLMAFMKKMVTLKIMGFQLFRGAKNGVFATMVNYRNGRVNWISEKFAGIEGDEMSYTPGDLAKANALVSAYMGRTVQGTHRNDKIWHLAKQSRYLTHDIIHKSDSTYLSKNNGSAMDKALSFYSIPEEWNSLSVMVAQLLHMKTKDGKSVFDQYEAVDGQLIWNGGVRGYTENAIGDKIPLRGLNSLEFGKMRRVYEKLHGQYRQDEKSTAELYFLGNLMMMFARHVPTYFRNNFGEPVIDTYQGTYRKKGTVKTVNELGEEQEDDVYEWIEEVNRGRYRLLWEWARGVRSAIEWSELEKRGAVEAGYTAFSSLVFATLSALFIGLVFDDDDEDSPQAKLLSSLVRDFASPINPAASLGITAGGKGAGNLVTGEIGKLFGNVTDLAWAYPGYKLGILTEKQALTNDGLYKGQKSLMNNLPLVGTTVQLNQFMQNDGDRNIFFDE